jgi:hypothetical protein
MVRVVDGEAAQGAKCQSFVQLAADGTQRLDSLVVALDGEPEVALLSRDVA